MAKPSSSSSKSDPENSGNQAPTPAPSAPQPTGPGGLPPNVAAGLCALFPLIGGIVFLILEKQDRLIRFHALQSIYFGGALFVYSVVFTIAFIVLNFLPVIGPILAILLGILYVIGWLGALVLYVFHVVKAFTGEMWSMPVIGQMVHVQVRTSS